MGHEYVAEVEKHSSQTDAARGFGGKYGVEKDRADKVSPCATQLKSCGIYQHSTGECGSMLLWKDGSGLRRVHHEDRSITFSKFLCATFGGHMLSSIVLI